VDSHITTTGVGSVSVAPDAMRVCVAVKTGAGSVAAAIEANVGLSEKVNAVARELAQPERIATRGLEVYADRLPDHSQTFVARHAFVVDCASFGDAADLLTLLVADVGDRLVVDGVIPLVSDDRAHLRLARERAFDDARTKAEELASYASARLARVLSVVEGERAGGVGVLAAPASASRFGFEPGSTEITAALTVAWALA
jgi:uncharacterized protein YggE